MVKAHPCKVKGVDPVVKRYRVRQDRGKRSRGMREAAARGRGGRLVACWRGVGRGPDGDGGPEVGGGAVREGGTPRRHVPGVCTRHNPSRLVRGRLRKIWRHARPRRPPATVVDTRRAILVEGIVQILLHHEQL